MSKSRITISVFFFIFYIEIWQNLTPKHSAKIVKFRLGNFILICKFFYRYMAKFSPKKNNPMITIKRKLKSNDIIIAKFSIKFYSILRFENYETNLGGAPLLIY